MKRTGRVCAYFQDFAAVTTLHGPAHIATTNRHPLETYVWVCVTLLAAATSFSLITDNWQRYSANPTVLALEKNYRVWRVPFPATTVCLLDRVNLTAATVIIQRLWGVRPGEKKFEYYMRFVRSVANLTYDNLQHFEEFSNDTDLYSIDMAALASKVQVNFTYSSYIFNPKFKNMKFKPTITEMGICHTFSGVISDFVSLRKDVHKAQVESLELPFCNFLNSLCYARIEDLPGVLRYYIHSPFELPDLSSNFFMVYPSLERDTSFRFLETVASRDLRSLHPRQRHCRFPDEPLRDMGLPVYSYNLCRMHCRRMVAHKQCGCAPYFYMPHKDIPLCTVKGLACLARHTGVITTLINADGSRVPCHCTLPCSNIEYYVDKDVERDWSYPVPCNIRFRWAIELYSKTRVRRDIIFGLEDLLVSFGGTAAFFLGCSVITFVELIYFFTLRLHWFLRGRQNKSLKKKLTKRRRPTIKIDN